MSEFQEFPKILHLGGDPDAKYVIVFSAEEEAAAEGFEVASFDKEQPEKRKPGRPRKTEAE